MALDKSAMQIFGFDPRSQDAHSKDPASLPDPSIMPDLVALPARYKGLGLRRMGDFVGAAAAIGGWDMVPRDLIGRTDEEGIRHEGLYPLLGSVFGANSQNPENADTRFSAFTDGRSQIGTQFGEAFNLLRLKAPGEAPCPLS